MKRAQIEALVGAYRGRIHTVASLHVLRQAALEEDDHAFLREHTEELELSDLLRWLSRCDAPELRGAIVKALASVALSAPERFRFEVLKAQKSPLDEHEWGEIAERTMGRVDPLLGEEIWAKVGGSETFRALCRQGRWTPARPLSAVFFPCELAEGETLEGRVARAFEPRGAPSRQVAAALFKLRYDEGACRKALSKPSAGVEPARFLFELERARLLGPFDTSGLPQNTVWMCEQQGDEDGQVREAYLRHIVLEYGEEGGARWLIEQVEAALARGVPPAALLSETPIAVRQKLPARLASSLRGEMGTLPLPSALRLGALLPAAVDEAALVRRAGKEAEEGDDDWGPLAALFPAMLGDAALFRAKRSKRGPELVALLDWMLSQGKSRKEAFSLAVDALRRGLLHRALIAWLAAQLTTRGAWEQAGSEVLGALIEQEALPELNDLLAMAWSQARRDAESDPEPPEGFRQAVHCAFAEALYGEVGEKLAEGDKSRAMLYASAMACLDPPPRFRRKLQGQRNRNTGSEEVEQILDVVRSFTRHGGGRDAELKDAIAAVHALASIDEPES